MEEFIPLENSNNLLEDDRASESDRERIKHLLVGSLKAVKKTIHLLHSLRYARAGQWSRPQIAGSLGKPEEVVSILIRNIAPE